MAGPSHKSRIRTISCKQLVAAFSGQQHSHTFCFANVTELRGIAAGWAMGSPGNKWFCATQKKSSLPMDSS